MNKEMYKRMIEVKKWFPIYINMFLMKLGLVRSNSNYTKYIILGRSRTGSNFLRGMLNSHPEVIAYGERYRSVDLNNIDKIDDVVSYLNESMFKKYPEGINAVGFKIFYNHSHKGENQRLWDQLIADKSVKVIHITRRNMLNTLYSRYKAGVTDKWVDNKGGSGEKVQFNIPYEEALLDFQRTSSSEKEYREMFKNHQVLEVVYEDLASDIHNNMEKVLTFLGVTNRDVVPTTYKQRSEKLRDGISNYDELKEKFKGSEYESFFNE